MRIKSLLLISLCILVLCGCSRSRLQNRHLWQTFNAKGDVKGYTTKCLLYEFGFPYSRKAVKIDGKRAEIWTYRTNLKEKYSLISPPGKTKYLKITIIDNMATYAEYE